MKTDLSISIYLDTRRAKANGKFPVKLRIYTASPRKQKFYPTSFEFTDKEFESIWNTTKPRTEHKETRMLLQAIENNALKLAEKIMPFTFEQFEKQLNRNSGEGVLVAYHYQSKIEALKQYDKLGTASAYNCSLNSFKEFVQNETRLNFSKLTFMDISPDLLARYEQFMTKTKGNSITSVGIYLRALRSLFNDAIAAKDIEPEIYPFGRRKYQTPAGKGTKRALHSTELKALFAAEPQNKEQAKAKAFWFFSFACNGMNIKDIALLRWKDIEGEKLTFFRAKTINTSKGNLKPIVAYLNDYSKQVLEQYGSSDQSPKSLVFDILNDSDTAAEKRAKIQNFTRFINQHIKKMAIAAGLPADISTYWARHSFATTSIRKGASLELVSESLGHGNMKTTQGYFAGFDSDTKKELAATLMEF
jgi:integrase/recombinase XerD